jgi:hypothetical protein
MNTDHATSFRALNIIFFGLLMGQVTFLAIAYFLVNGDGKYPVDEELHDILRFIVPTVFLGSLGASYFVPKMQIQNNLEGKSLEDKLLLYRTSVITRLALIEGPSLFAIVAFLMTGQPYYLIVTLLSLLIFASLKPSTNKCIVELHLSKEEADEIQKA